MGKKVYKKKRTVSRPADAYKKESHVVRLSPEVDKALRAIGHRGEAYDNILRRILGLEANKYRDEVAKTYFGIISDKAPMLFTDEAEAAGAAIRYAVKMGVRTAFQVKKLRDAL